MYPPETRELVKSIGPGTPPVAHSGVIFLLEGHAGKGSANINRLDQPGILARCLKVRNLANEIWSWIAVNVALEGRAYSLRGECRTELVEPRSLDDGDSVSGIRWLFPTLPMPFLMVATARIDLDTPPAFADEDRMYFRDHWREALVRDGPGNQQRGRRQGFCIPSQAKNSISTHIEPVEVLSFSRKAAVTPIGFTVGDDFRGNGTMLGKGGSANLPFVGPVKTTTVDKNITGSK